jgi:hypothetical protein
MDVVIRRMGARKGSVEANLSRDIDVYYKKAQSAFSVRGRADTYDIRHMGDEAVELAGHRVESRLLAKMLRNSGQAYLMCASIPKKDVERINEAIEKGQGLRALVYDAYASELADGALDIMMQSRNDALRRTGGKLTAKRFSAGYGDLDIKYQGFFYDLLQMKTLGVDINDSFLLIPEKSVIAIAGVE